MLRDRFFLVLAALAALHVALLATWLIVPDLATGYPFFDDPDAYDWLLNGLRLAGEDVRYSARPPLVPLTIAVLERSGVLALYPLLFALATGAGALVAYRLARRVAPPGAAFAAALALFVAHRPQLLALHLMVDGVAATFLAASALAFLRGGERPRSYVVAGLLAGLSAITQPLALLLPLPAGAVLLLHRRDQLRSPPLWVGAGLFALLPATWEAIKLALFGRAGDVVVEQWSRLHPHAGGAAFWSLAGALGLPAALLLGAGLVGAFRALRSDPERAFHALAFVSVSVFFAFFYDFHAGRFALYSLAFAAPLLAAPLARLPRRVAAGVAILVIAVAALPPPGKAGDFRRVAVWPLPPLALTAPSEPRRAVGDVVVAPLSARLERLPARAAFRRLVWVEAARTADRRERREDGARTALPAPGPVLVFSAGRELGADRYRTTGRLGLALRARVQVLPRPVFDAARGRLDLVPIGRMDDRLAFRLGGLPAPALALFPAAVPPSRPAPAAWSPSPAVETTLLGRLLAALGPAPGRLLVFGASWEDPVVLQLAVTADADLVVVAPEDSAALWERIGPGRRGETLVGPYLVGRVEWARRQAAFVAAREIAAP